MIRKNFKKKNNATIALKAFYAKKENIYPAYVSKNNSNREKEVLSMIPDGKNGIILQ